jgi:nucleoside 2-deoxyribosyltransferase
MIDYKIKDCVVIGSFRKHYTSIVDFICLIEHKYKVLSPMRSHIVDAMDDFVILDSDILNATCEKEIQVAYIETKVLDNIRKASFIYVYNPGGFIGTGTAFEIGFAIKENKKICAAFKPKDKFLRSYISKIVPPEDFLDVELENIFRIPDKVTTSNLSMLSLDARNGLNTYIYNLEGHINVNSAIKIGYAIGSNKEIHTAYRPRDIMISKFTMSINPIENIDILEDDLYGRHYKKLCIT